MGWREIGIRVLCECNSFDCDKIINLSLEENLEIHIVANQIIIIDGCSIGPDSTDEFVEKKDGYSLYKETQ